METVNYSSIWCVIILSYKVQNQRTAQMSTVILKGTEALNSHGSNILFPQFSCDDESNCIYFPLKITSERIYVVFPQENDPIISGKNNIQRSWCKKK